MMIVEVLNKSAPFIKELRVKIKNNKPKCFCVHLGDFLQLIYFTPLNDSPIVVQLGPHQNH